MSSGRKIRIKHGTRTSDDIPGMGNTATDIQKDIMQERGELDNNSTLTDDVRLELANRLIYYVGDTGHMDIHPGDYQYSANGKIVSMTPPLHIEFGPGGGRTRGYDPNDKNDVEWMRRVDAWLDEGMDWRIERFKIRRLDHDATPPPFQNWSSLNASALKTMVENMMGEDDDSNLSMLKRFARYELEQEQARVDVLKFLDDLAEKPSVDDVLSAEIDL